MSISSKDIKILFGNSAGRCNICNQQLVEGDIHIGEMAHIIAKNIKGPRGNISCENINSHHNLILLCPTHHSLVDADPVQYPPERLIELKQEHEKNVSLRLDNNQEYNRDLFSLNKLLEHIPIQNFRGIVSDLPYKVSLDFFSIIEGFEHFYTYYPTLYPFYNDELTRYWNDCIRLANEIDKLLGSNISIKNNSIITMSEMLRPNSSIEHGYNIYVSSDDGYIVINKKFLKPEQVQLVVENMNTLSSDFLIAHTNLIIYIKQYYGNVTMVNEQYNALLYTLQ